ncbi:UNKNOWN [Stylonychia lemnae]|uniref:Uncharacterized protein n=1 Tax=Stylonychia lemnae TaxID=5949 RepID=A0A078B267_STYLE|nr:UNKNOWN [Stylonychia lemnae]|eukprot:CDW87352.1 UNKNOWN [Stylonychia lemnae]
MTTRQYSNSNLNTISSNMNGIITAADNNLVRAATAADYQLYGGQINNQMSGRNKGYQEDVMVKNQQSLRSHYKGKYSFKSSKLNINRPTSMQVLENNGIHCHKAKYFPSSKLSQQQSGEQQHFNVMRALKPQRSSKGLLNFQRMAAAFGDDLISEDIIELSRNNSNQDALFQDRPFLPIHSPQYSDKMYSDIQADLQSKQNVMNATGEFSGASERKMIPAFDWRKDQQQNQQSKQRTNINNKANQQSKQTNQKPIHKYKTFKKQLATFQRQMYNRKQMKLITQQQQQNQISQSQERHLPTDSQMSQTHDLGLKISNAKAHETSALNESPKELIVCRREPIIYKKPTNNEGQVHSCKNNEEVKRRRRRNRGRNQFKNKIGKNFQNEKINEPYQNQQQLRNFSGKSKFIKKSQNFGKDKAFKREAYDQFQRRIQKAKHLKPFEVSKNRQHTPHNTSQFLAQDFMNRKCQEISIDIEFSEMKDSTEQNIVNKWQNEKAQEGRNCQQKEREFRLDMFGDSQQSTSVGDISGEEDLYQEQHRLSSQPGLTMQGMVDEDMFTIDLSESEDSTINSPLKDYFITNADIVSQPVLTNHQTKMISIDDLDSNELMMTIESNQELITSLENELMKKMNMIKRNKLDLE